MRSSLILALCLFVVGCGGSASDNYTVEAVEEFNSEIAKLNGLADEGDTLWEAGDKQRAVDFYLRVIASSRLDSDSPAIFDDDFDVSKITKPEFDPQVILTRVAEYQIAAGQTVQAEQTFMKALDSELALNLSTPEANAAFAEAKLKHENELARRYGGSIDDAFNRGRGAVSSSNDHSESQSGLDQDFFQADGSIEADSDIGSHYNRGFSEGKAFGGSATEDARAQVVSKLESAIEREGNGTSELALKRLGLLRGRRDGVEFGWRAPSGQYKNENAQRLNEELKKRFPVDR